MEQTLVMDEPNSEADFCFGHSIHKGVIGLELSIDADHKVFPRAFMWSAADECTEVWSRFLHHITKAYPSLNSSSIVLKVDGAKGAWNAIKTVTKRHPFRDHRHRADNAQLNFGIKGKHAYLKIAKARDIDERDKLIKKQSEKFQKWVLAVPFAHWSAASQTLVHGQYETSCVEGMNNHIKNRIEIRGADPITALRRWIEWESSYYEERKALAAQAKGPVTPRMSVLLRKQRLATTAYQVSSLSSDKRRACVTHLSPQQDDVYCPTFNTEVLKTKYVVPQE